MIPNDYESIDVTQLCDPIIGSIAKDWMLVTVRTPDGGSNPMTASWGGVGFLWKRPVFWCVLRPQRYTHELAQKTDAVSVSFYSEEMRPALSYCGTHSGRDGDKEKAAGLTPVACGDHVFYEGARMVFLGRKLYCGQMKQEGFVLPDIPDECYPNGDYHYVYVCEIEQALVRRDLQK